MNTETSRRLSVEKKTPISRIVIREQPFIVLNPTICVPWRSYRLELDPESGTCWIHQEAAS